MLLRPRRGRRLRRNKDIAGHRSINAGQPPAGSLLGSRGLVCRFSVTTYSTSLETNTIYTIKVNSRLSGDSKYYWQ